MKTRTLPSPHNSPSRASRKTTAAACTIISRNYLSHARILGESFREYHPDGRFYVLVIDGLPDGIEFGDGVDVIGPDVLDLPYFFELCFKYDVTELATAVKPSLLLSLLRRFNERKVIYFDPDILITRQLSELFAAMNRANVVLTPHLLSPIPVDGLKPSEQDILRSGAYNLGFIALRESSESVRFLLWWQERLRDFCHIDPSHGLFTDQKWIDLVPGLFADVSILHDQTYNVAYWNLHSRLLTRDGDRFLVNGRPLAFFHFSGFDPRTPEALSKHQNRTGVTAGSPLAEILEHYSRLQFARRFEESNRWDYGYSRFRNGVPVHSLFRRLYLRLDPQDRLRFGNPFETEKPGAFFEWATSPSKDYESLSPFLYEIYQLRYDVASAFPNVAGTDREGFLTWARSHGAREMAYDPILAEIVADPASNGSRRVGSRYSDVASPAREPRLVHNQCSTDAGLATLERNGSADYQLLIAQIRSVVESQTQPNSLIAVASKGDDALLAFHDRAGCHFPQTSDGRFAGFNPADSTQAIAHLETVRQRGADFLVFPATSDWWLDYYVGFRKHLNSRYQRLDYGGNQCAIFDLRNPRQVNNPTIAREGIDEGQAEQVFGVNVAGNIASEKGLGEGVRSDLRGLQAAGIPFAVNNRVDPSSENPDQAYTSFARDNPFPVNLVHVNADQVLEFAKANGEQYFLGRYNIGYWAWELSVFPDKWKDSFRYFDEIWVPSTFVLDAVARAAPVPVVRIPHSLPEVLPTASVTRATFGLPDDKFVFLFMFDCHSVIARKNPFGLIKAFCNAFEPADETVLVVKCSHAGPDHLRQLREATSGANVLILDVVLSREETNTLLSLCDCYVSLHHSEGFGLTMAEAMSFEKPVIATAYSGNMDFMTAANSFPVKYSLTEIAENHGPYRKGNIWAEPDLDHATELMRFVFNNPKAASAMARRARQDVIALLHPRVVGDMMRRRLACVPELRRLQDSVAEEGTTQSASANIRTAPYEQLLASIRQLAGIALAGDGTVLVVSRGDEQLLQLGDRRGCHFPQDPDGKYAGYHPRDSEDAIAHLEELRARGAKYLLFPNTAFWWLEHYDAFRDHLESRYRRTWADSQCLIYHLSPSETSLVGQVRAQLDETALALQRLTTTEDRVSARLEQQEVELKRIASAVCGIAHTLSARPYMCSDVFGTGDLEQPMGYGPDTPTHRDGPATSVDFADLFRGPEPFIAERQRVYLPFLKGREKIVDLGCGRGEFLRLLRDTGITAIGVEMDFARVERLRGEGLNVVLADAVAFLREQPEASLDAIFSAQVIEHLEPQRLADLLRLARTRLHAGGVLIAETVNPESFQALKVFSVDLTHQHPIFPQVLLQMCCEAGFPTARIFYPLGGGFTQVQYATAGEYAVIAGGGSL